MSHKAHSSLHQSAAWSATQTQPALTHRSLLREGPAVPGSHSGNTEPKTCPLPPLQCLQVWAEGRASPHLPFGGCTGSCACFPAPGTLGNGALLGNRDSHRHGLSSPSRTLPVPATHTRAGRAFQQDKPQLSAGTKGRRNVGIPRSCCSDLHIPLQTAEPPSPELLPPSASPQGRGRALTCTDLKVVMNGSMMW